MTSVTSAFRLQKIPRSIWALGFVSMFMDISSEMIHALLPVYLVTVLGTSNLTVGLIEGIAEATRRCCAPVRCDNPPDDVWRCLLGIAHGVHSGASRDVGGG